MERTKFGTCALTTELKYLNLDPSQFQHLPEEEDDDTDMYYGIEKGKDSHCLIVVLNFIMEREVKIHLRTYKEYSLIYI